MNVAIDFENNGTWSDVSAYLQRAEITQGSTRVESPIIRYEAGTCVLTLDNSDRRFDPTNLTGPYTMPEGTPSSGTQQAVANKTLTYGHGFTVSIPSLDPETIEASLRSTSWNASWNTSYAVSKPTGTASGDVLVAFQTSDWGSAGSMGTPSGGGWQLLTSRTYGSYTLHTKVWWKVAGGAEPSTYTFTQGVDSDGICVIAAVRDAASGTPIFAGTGNNGTAFFDTPGIVPGGLADFELRFVSGTGAGSGVRWDWSGTDGPYTETDDRQDDAFTTVSLAAKTLSALATGTGGTLVKPMRPVRVRAIWDAPGTNTNLVNNTSFETNTTGWAVGTGTTLTRVSTPTPVDGSWAGQVSRSAAAPSNVHLIECQGITGATGTAGKHVFVSAWVRIPAATRSKVTGVAFAATGIPATFVSPVTGGSTFGSDTWQRIELAATLSADVANVQLQFWTDGTHTNGQVVAYVDDVHVEISEHDLFTGYVDSWDIEWTGPNSSSVTVPCTDAFKIFANIERTAVAAVGASETTGARINRILNGIGWPSSKRSISTGDVVVQATTLDGNALEEMQLTVDTEVGELYMSPDGMVFFRNRNAINNDARSNTSQATFGDADPELRYSDLTFTNDDTQLANRVIITRAGSSSPQQADDLASQAEFLVKAFERTDLIMTTDAAALNYAQYVLSLSAQPELRFDGLVVNPQRDETRLFPQVLNRLVGDRITVRRRPPGGGLVEQECFIRGRKHEITPGSWLTSWTLQSTAAGGSFFIIGHATLGRLDNNPLGF